MHRTTHSTPLVKLWSIMIPALLLAACATGREHRITQSLALAADSKPSQIRFVFTKGDPSRPNVAPMLVWVYANGEAAQGLKLPCLVRADAYFSLIYSMPQGCASEYLINLPSGRHDIRVLVGEAVAQFWVETSVDATTTVELDFANVREAGRFTLGRIVWAIR